MGDDDASDFVRLHISPLDAELVKVVIPASVLPSARNISYHTLETFPERRYGFVDLPAADAEKLRRKLNGTTLKGCKMRVEKARPETRLEPTGPEDGALEAKKKKLKDDKDKSKKRKREPDVLEGVALHDRQVKRGWTEAPTANKRKDRKNKESKDKDKGKEKEKEKKKRPKSKYTEGEECLLKTKLPPNTTKNLTPEELEQKKRSSKKKGSSSRQVVIHEFEKTTTFPSFLKTSTTTDQKKAAEFVEGKGWVDEEGNLVEEVKEKKEKTKLPRRPKKAPPPKKVPEESDDDDSTSSSGTSSEGTSSEDEEESEAESEADAKQEAKKETKKEAAQIPSLDEDAKREDQSSKATKAATPTPSSKTPASKSTPTNTKPLAIKIPPPETPTNGSKVHPLEALYKRPKPDGNNPTSAPKEAEPFSFFAAADEDDIDETPEATAPPASLAPMTPFTRQDFEWRNVRSAAPTPDTAHPSRAHRFWASPDKEDDVEMEDDGEGGEDGDDDGPAQGRHSATTDFQKWFWENRRDLNRSWMTRRKTAAKERRHRENKARASKAV
ncbi:hypothetical protein BBK36DRAFT_155701 [Trichoderma citrinoviride]|uniref:RRM domain-containing protein n=1 Tax=Trichoderma citrinoviride TaxID=58853 RepID=A0A2T4BIR0_9HYPO|nr:hypothetical protein BBK36DRAFT_155701 [Trichoderma citrinoviride]PTB69139.1 hypothetical protein BBK36DRAFT_155701 [Trichoderma citrinoviride]